MNVQGLRAPNQRPGTTTVETTTTGPNEGDYAHRVEVATTSGPGNDEPVGPIQVATTGPGSGNYARPVEVATTGPSSGELARRITVFVAGIVQSLILLRIVLLLLDARASNGLVAVIMNVSSVFAAPFQGILHTNAVAASGSVLDVAAIIALIGWTLVEGLVIAGIGIFRREPAFA